MINTQIINIKQAYILNTKILITFCISNKSVRKVCILKILKL